MINNELENKINIELLDKEKCYDNSDLVLIYESVSVTLKITNVSDKNISGIQGKIKFFDIFDNELCEIEILFDEKISINESKIWKSKDWNEFIKFNQSDSRCQRFIYKEVKKIKLQWLPSKIISE